MSAAATVAAMSAGCECARNRQHAKPTDAEQTCPLPNCKSAPHTAVEFEANTSKALFKPALRLTTRFPGPAFTD